MLERKCSVSEERESSVEWNRKRLISACRVAAVLLVVLFAGRAWAEGETEVSTTTESVVEDALEDVEADLEAVDSEQDAPASEVEEIEDELDEGLEDEAEEDLYDDDPEDFDEGILAASEDTDYFDDFANAASRYDHRGWIFRLGVVGSFFDTRSSKVDFDPGVGFALAAGVRHNDWVVTELSFSWVFESETNDYERLVHLAETSKESVEEYELALDFKFYPVGYLQPSAGKDWIQPYLSAGVGLSDVMVGDVDQSRFMLRFGAGVDVLLTDHYGFYVDGGYAVITSTARNNGGNLLDGAGRIGVGALVLY